MADSMSVTGGTNNIDVLRWKKLTAEEIIKEKSKGEDIPTEIVTWAQQMAAFAKIPDDVTYEQVDGDIGLEALDKLGIPPEEVGLTSPEEERPVQTEEPDAVKNPARISEAPPERNNIFMNATPGQAGDVKPQDTIEESDQDTLTLADPALTTNPEEIRKRKARKGLA